MAEISKDISAGAVALATNRVQEILRNKGVATTPISKEAQEDIVIGIIDDEEEERDYEGVFYDILDTGNEEEVEQAMTEEAHKLMTEETQGYPTGNVINFADYKNFVGRQENMKSAGERAVNNAGMHTAFINPEILRRVAQTTPKRKQEDFIFGEGTYEVCGKSKKCTEAAFNLNFSSNDNDDMEENMDRLSDAITFEVVKNFPKVHSIAVSSNYLIINNTCFTPNIANTEAKFPLDSRTYIQNGCIAPLINWRKLLKHSRNTCITLSFDSTEFYLTYVGDSLGLGRKIGVSSMFKLLHNLDTFYLEGEDVSKEDLNSPKSAPIKKKLATKKRNFKIMDGYRLDVCKGTQGFQDFTFKSLKDYATNRGNKGFIRYAFGTVARFGFAVVGGTLNAGSHLVRGAYRGIKSALTPVEDEDIYL